MGCKWELGDGGGVPQKVKMTTYGGHLHKQGISPFSFKVQEIIGGEK